MFDRFLRDFVALGLGLICAAGMAHGQEPAGPSPAAYPSEAELQALTPGAWTLVVLPDTQYYVDHSREKIPPTPEIFQSMVDWCVANRQANNIQLVLHVGDIVDNDEDTEWQMAKSILSTLDGQLPYVLTLGNHDYQDNSRVRRTRFNRFFKAAEFERPEGGLVAVRKQGELENAAYEFQAPDGRKLLVLALEWGARDEAVEWADTLLKREAYQDHTAILLTHAYLYGDDTWLDWAAKGEAQNGNPHSYGTGAEGNTNDGRELWLKLVKAHPQLELVFCGHITGHKAERMYLGDRSETGYLKSVATPGQTVHQMLFNAQRQGDSGEGWMRLLEFQPDGKTVIVKTYSPWLDARGLTSWRSDPDDYFRIELSPHRP